MQYDRVLGAVVLKVNPQNVKKQIRTELGVE